MRWLAATISLKVSAILPSMPSRSPAKRTEKSPTRIACNAASSSCGWNVSSPFTGVFVGTETPALRLALGRTSSVLDISISHPRLGAGCSFRQADVRRRGGGIAHKRAGITPQLRNPACRQALHHMEPPRLFSPAENPDYNPNDNAKKRVPVPRTEQKFGGSKAGGACLFLRCTKRSQVQPG